MINLIIENNSKIFMPCVEGEVTLKTERYGSPGELKFSVVSDGKLNFTEGNNVKLEVDGNSIFSGFIFIKKELSQTSLMLQHMINYVILRIVIHTITQTSEQTR